jgi:hypothetical protein
VKNIQVIDGATNCVYPVYAADDTDFDIIFPNGQDVEFAEDLFARLGDDAAQRVTERLWLRPQNKKEIEGIHGTLFYGLLVKKKYYPTKKENEAVALPNLSSSTV